MVELIFINAKEKSPLHSRECLENPSLFKCLLIHLNIMTFKMTLVAMEGDPKVGCYCLPFDIASGTFHFAYNLMLKV